MKTLLQLKMTFLDVIEDKKTSLFSLECKYIEELLTHDETDYDTGHYVFTSSNEIVHLYQCRFKSKMIQGE